MPITYRLRTFPPDDLVGIRRIIPQPGTIVGAVIGLGGLSIGARLPGVLVDAGEGLLLRTLLTLLIAPVAQVFGVHINTAMDPLPS